MANEKNLKPLTTEKAREIGAKGGQASGKAKREKKLIKQVASEVINSQVETGELRKLGERLGLTGDFTFMELLMRSVTIQTVKKGNFNDLLALQKLAGEESETTSIINIENDPLSQALEELAKKL